MYTIVSLSTLPVRGPSAPHGAAQAEEGEKETEVVPVRWFGGEGKPAPKESCLQSSCGHLLCSSGNSTQCSVVTFVGRKSIQNRGDMCIRPADTLLDSRS